MHFSRCFWHFWYATSVVLNACLLCVGSRQSASTTPSMSFIMAFAWSCAPKRWYMRIKRFLL